jgi:hypothetical protein
LPTANANPVPSAMVSDPLAPNPDNVNAPDEIEPKLSAPSLFAALAPAAAAVFEPDSEVPPNPAPVPADNEVMLPKPKPELPDSLYTDPAPELTYVDPEVPPSAIDPTD